MKKWTTAADYINAPNRLDPSYCRAIFTGCQLSQLHAYSWLEFVDLTGIEDEGDYVVGSGFDVKAPQ